MCGRMIGKAVLAVILAAGMFSPVWSAPEKIRVEKSVRDNPALFFSGIPGNQALSAELKKFLGVCGWFDLTADAARADYELKASPGQGGCRLDLSMGGAPVGTWNIRFAPGKERVVAQNTADAIIQHTFKELKIKGFCSTRIAFCAETGRGVKNIYACDIDGGRAEQITNFHSLCVEPCWFPGGRSIGYSKYHKSGISVCETQLSPKRSRVLVNFDGINTGAAISPDGRSVAVISSPDHKVDLYVRSLVTGKTARLTNSVAVEASPCWSPDGRTLAYVSDATGGPRIHLISAAGGGHRVLPVIRGGNDAVTPDWSYENKIVYAVRVNGNYTLAVYDVASGSNTRVTEEPGNWESPGWAADGRHVVATRSNGTRSAIYVVDTWTGKSRLLFRSDFNLSMPTWSKAARK